jgi:hypothetical protein
MKKFSEYQQKLWDLYYNNGVVFDGDEEKFLRNYPTDTISKIFYDQWKPKPSRSAYIDNENQLVGSVETRKHKQSKPNIKKCSCKKK